VTVALKHVTSQVPAVDAEDVSISPALAAIVHKLMQKDPRDRFQSAVEVAKALREARERPHVTDPFDIAAREHAAVSGNPRTIPNPKPRPARYPDRVATGVLEGDFERDDRDEHRGPPGRLVFTLAVVIALAIAVATGYFFANRPGGMFGGPTTVALASFVGQTADEAEKRLDTLGVRWNVIPIPSEEVSANRVVRQEPAANPNISTQTVVQLYVSSGLPTVDLIDVRQYSSDDAQRYLRNAKLSPKLTQVFDKSPRGTVLSERPAPGSSVPIHSTVSLVVSEGLKPVAVPDVVSQTLDDAQTTLGERQLKLVVTERDPSDDIPADTVTSQNPSPGSSLDPGSTVSVVVSSGSPQITVPGVEGSIVDAAQQTLSGAGLASNVEYLVDASRPAGTVVKQDPEKAASLKKGSAVTLDVAVPGTIPDVAGKSPDDAATLLQDSGYKIGNRAYVQEGADGTVARTEPVAGTALRPGETVTLYINGTSLESP
jgi:serine/threonine-protein kinase